jgi:prolyl oligopeptidase
VALHYPPTRADATVVDDYHGEKVADPYRWLEDTNSGETAEWIARQNELTADVLRAATGRDAVRARLTQIWDHPRVGAPYEHGGRWFQLRNSGLQPQSVLFVMSSPTDPGEVLLDPNELSADGTVALIYWHVSTDGDRLAYATSSAGSDWMTWRIRDVDSRADLADVLEWSKFSGAVWAPDAGTLYYVAYDAPQAGREFLDEQHVPRVMRHRLGTAQAADELVHVAADQPDWNAAVAGTDDGRFLVLEITRGTFPETQLHVLDLTDPAGSLQALLPDFSCQATVVGNVDTTFWLCTDHDAPRRRVVAVELTAPEPAAWREIVPEAPDTLLEADRFGGRVVTHYLHHAHSRLALIDPDTGAAREVDLGGIVSVLELSGHADSDVVHVGTASFTNPGSIWSLDVATGRAARIATTDALDETAVVTTQEFVASFDGTKVPVFLIHRRDIAPTGAVPVLLYGYGGFNIPVTPVFSALRATWVERGGLAVVANLRGGGEYGREWYDAGRHEHKQNVFDDFCAVAGWLGGESGWSEPGRVAIMGGSNGGLLVGACLTQRPELFGAAVPIVGVMDMLRYHKFTIGWAWKSDYGDPDDPQEYRWVRSYSPLHNIVDGRSYAATLVVTGDHDDRVAPGHSFKFAARLQAAQGGDAPVLIRVETSAGHGAGKPTQKMLDEAVDILAFLELTVGG